MIMNIEARIADNNNLICSMEKAKGSNEIHRLWSSALRKWRAIERHHIIRRKKIRFN